MPGFFFRKEVLTGYSGPCQFTLKMENNLTLGLHSILGDSHSRDTKSFCMNLQKWWEACSKFLPHTRGSSEVLMRDLLSHNHS